MHKKLLRILFVCFSILAGGCNNDPPVTNPVPNTPDEVLRQYFVSIENQEYHIAAELYGGDYEMLRSNNPEVAPDDYQTLLKRYMELHGGTVVKIDKILKKTNVSEDEYVYELTFLSSDNKPFRNGLHYTYTVKKINGQFKVLELPPYLS